MSGTIKFSADTYNRLISELGTLVDGLHEAETGHFPLTADVQVQPAGQVWQPAADLVAAAQKQLGAMHQWNSSTADAVTGLSTALTRAKAVLRNVDDLATLAVQKFQPELGDWAGPNRNQISIPLPLPTPVRTPGTTT
jgi:hypothetical protein